METNELGLVQTATEKSHDEFKSAMSTFNKGALPKLSGYIRSMLRMQDARPFMSDSGFVGLCPDSAKKGDMICLPLGTHIPYVFRHVKGKSWQLIGEVYIFDLMDSDVLAAPGMVLQVI
jgi:hypothetical protein